MARLNWLSAILALASAQIVPSSSSSLPATITPAPGASGSGCTPVRYSATPFFPDACSADGTLYVSERQKSTTTAVPWPSWTDIVYGPTTGPSASAVTCNAKWAEYRQRSWSLLYHYSETGTTSILTSSTRGMCYRNQRTEAYSDPPSGPTTTLCDGVPRAIGPIETIVSWYPDMTGSCTTLPATYSPSITTQWFDLQATPTCSFASTDCGNIWQSYDSKWSSWMTAYSNSGVSQTAVPSPYEPWSCWPTPTTTYTPTTAPTPDPDSFCPGCYVSASAAVLYYWPSSEEPNLCSKRDAFPTTEPTNPAPKTAVIGNQTIVSPSAYFTYQTMSASNVRRRFQPGPVNCGAEHTSGGLVLNPQELSSARPVIQTQSTDLYATTYSAYPFNLADLNTRTVGSDKIPLVPLSAYRAGKNCIETNYVYAYNSQLPCTMVRADYTPSLALPVTKIDPKWGSCVSAYYPDISYVPLPLEKGAPAANAVPTAAVSGTASPASKLASPTAAPTGRIFKAQWTGVGLECC